MSNVTRCGEEIDECESGPCLHGGACTDLLGDYACDCAGTGFEGDVCQVRSYDDGTRGQWPFRPAATRAMRNRHKMLYDLYYLEIYVHIAKNSHFVGL